MEKKDYGKEEVCTMKFSASVSGAVWQFSYWFAHGTLGYPLLEGIAYIGEILMKESSFAEQAFAILGNRAA